MKKFALGILVVFSLNGFTQNHFQQKVDYKIDVQLYDQENTLRGFESFEYYNNSPDELGFIYMHLWPNAYKNNETQLAKQLYGMGNTSLLEANESERGYIDSLDFKVDGERVVWEYDPEHIDICKLILKEPLKPGSKIMISTPFKVKIPTGNISRLGFVDESYQITQWYPKPAVYDAEGWHQMSYLTQGEFYSEYGTFDVSITLPKNYVVGATGDLQTASEIAFLEERAAVTLEKFEADKFDKKKKSTVCPDSDEALKTIRYTQKDVHDFAWFADKRFEVLKGEVELPNTGAKVTSWGMFVPHHADLWEDCIEYLNDATFYYSKWNGDYPYKHVTAVDGTISAGGGMEYPNVTIIGSASSKEELEVVIVHEVGHNWFYGLLGSNERDHAWMDEGLNTLNEIRYIETKYPNNKRMSEMGKGIVEKIHFEDLGHQEMSGLTYVGVAGLGLDQPIELTSDDYTSMNYGAIVYAKTGLVFLYLKDYLGEEKFDQVMQAYYTEWHYKHPQPEDIKRTLERESGKDLSWLFEDLIKTTKQIDHKILKVKKVDGKSIVTVRNTGQIDSPIRVDGLNFGKVRETQWIEPGETEAVFEGVSFDQFVIDYEKQMPEMNRNNNYWTQKGLFHRTEPFKMEFIGGDNEGDKWNSYWMPAIGLNVYDRLMLGVVFHNQTLPKNKFEYTVAPMYSFGRNSIAGFADFNYSWIPAKNIRMITLGTLAKTFGRSDVSTEAISGGYYVVQPYLNFEIGKPAAKKNYKQRLTLKGSYVSEPVTINLGSTLIGTSLDYLFKLDKNKHAFKAAINVDYYNAKNTWVGININSEVLNASLELEYTLKYWESKRKSLTIRGFIGQNIFNKGSLNTRYGFSLGGQTGSQDVTYEQYMFGRNRTSGLWGNQRIENHGGFKTTARFGVTNNTLLATNLYVELPFIPLVGLFVDYGMFESSGNLVSVMDLGLGVKITKRFGVYFPLFESDNLKTSFPDGTGYGEKIRFTLKLTDLSLGKIAAEQL